MAVVSLSERSGATAAVDTRKLGVALWIVYGVAIGSLPVIISNVVTLTLALLLLAFKVRVTFSSGS